MTTREKYKDAIEIFESALGVNFEEFIALKRRWRSLPHSEIIKLMKLREKNK